MATKRQRTRLTIDWQPNERDYLFCEHARPDLNVRQVVTEFRTYWMGRLDSAGEKADWSMTWRNWVAKARAKPTYAPKVQYQTKTEKARDFTDALEGRRQIEQANRIVDIN
jgi:hypothetical protein